MNKKELLEAIRKSGNFTPMVEERLVKNILSEKGEPTPVSTKRYTVAQFGNRNNLDESYSTNILANALHRAHNVGGNNVWDSEVSKWIVMPKPQRAGTEAQKNAYSREVIAKILAGNIKYYTE